MIARIRSGFRLLQHGSSHTYVFGFSALGAEKPNTNKRVSCVNNTSYAAMLPPLSFILDNLPARHTQPYDALEW